MPDSENVQIVRAIYAAWQQGASARSYIAEDIEYVNPPDAVEPGVRYGRKSFGAIRGSYDDVQVRPLAFVEASDDQVLVVARVTAKGRSSGFPVEWVHGYVWTIRAGVAVRFLWFNRPEEAYLAAGLEAPPPDAWSSVAP